MTGEREEDKTVAADPAHADYRVVIKRGFTEWPARYSARPVDSNLPAHNVPYSLSRVELPQREQEPSR